MDDKATRDLLIELKITIEHLTKRVDESLVRTDDKIAQLEKQVKEDMNEIEMRLRVLERYFWIAIGGLAIIQLALPYISKLVRG